MKTRRYHIAFPFPGILCDPLPRRRAFRQFRHARAEDPGIPVLLIVVFNEPGLFPYHRVLAAHVPPTPEQRKEVA